MADLFPTLFVATAFGVCNFFAKFASIFAPQVAEQTAPLPMLLMTSLNAVGLVATLFVKTLKD